MHQTIFKIKSFLMRARLIKANTAKQKLKKIDV